MTMRSISVCIAFGLLVGCGSVRAPATRYYKLDIPPAQVPAGPAAPASLRVEPFRCAALLRQDRIVYRPSPVEVGYYEYHQWAEPPVASITKALADQLTKRAVFHSVEISDAGEKADYVLRGMVDRLQEVDYMGGVRVQVSISAELEDTARQQVVWSSATSAELRVSKGDVQAVVTAMSQASQQSITRLLTDFSKFLQVNRLSASSVADPPH